MTKQRRSFFVDDILHMVMPMNKPENCSNDKNDLKRKQSATSEDDDRNEPERTSNKKFCLHNYERTNDNNVDDDDDDDNDKKDDDNDESNQSHTVDTIKDGHVADEESCSSDNTNHIDNNSGKL